MFPTLNPESQTRSARTRCQPVLSGSHPHHGPPNCTAPTRLRQVHVLRLLHTPLLPLATRAVLLECHLQIVVHLLLLLPPLLSPTLRLSGTEGFISTRGRSDLLTIREGMDM